MDKRTFCPCRGSNFPSQPAHTSGSYTSYSYRIKGLDTLFWPAKTLFIHGTYIDTQTHINKSRGLMKCLLHKHKGLNSISQQVKNVVVTHTFTPDYSRNYKNRRFQYMFQNESFKICISEVKQSFL